MATVTSTATELPAWKLRLRGVAAHYKSLKSEDVPNFFATRPESFGVSLQGIQFSDGGLDKLKEAHAGKVKEQLAGFSADASYDGALKSIGSTLISEHQETSDDVKGITDKLKDEGANKQTAKERMEEGRKKAKEKSNESIDKAFDAAEATIDSLPQSQQDKATDVWLSISDGFLSFWNEVLQGFLEIVNAFVDWLASVWETVKNVWNDVKNVFESAWDWFKGLF
ncbi:hypothetical protein QQZ08_001289 [Neonectria magnoliae]|uniref:Uncharacterized protein n=1 Tax=Neonectria magnoliae TaxID=2732573 RepID=A0ABR1IFC2_9HYPO